MDEGPHPRSGASSRLISQAPLSRPSLADPFHIDPILPDTYTPPPGPSKLPRPSTSTDAPIPLAIPSTIHPGSDHGEGHPTYNFMLRSRAISSSWSTASDTRRPSARSRASQASPLMPAASLSSPSRQRPLQVFPRKQPRPRNVIDAATENSEAPPAYEDIDSRDNSARVEQAPLMGRAI